MAAFAQQQCRSESSHLLSRAKPDRPMPWPAHPTNPLFAQQQCLGNQAIQHLLHSERIQAKLTVSQPGDKYELEADRVAEAVMRLPDPQVISGVSEAPTKIQRKCATCTSGKRDCPRCAAEEEKIQRKPLASTITPLAQHQGPQAEFEEDEEEFFAKETSGRASEVTQDVEAQIKTMKGSGQPLSESTRASFESRFGYDFNQVRAHTGPRAAKLAQIVNARAFTVGQDIVFGAGQHAPETMQGKRLIAHELAHVVQQSAAEPKIQRQPEEPIRKKYLRQIRVPKPSFRFSSFGVYLVPEETIKETEEFKSYMDLNFVWQWREHVTEEEALLACRLMLVDMEAGIRINWPFDARKYLNRSRTALRFRKAFWQWMQEIEESRREQPSTPEPHTIPVPTTHEEEGQDENDERKHDRVITISNGRPIDFRGFLREANQLVEELERRGEGRGVIDELKNLIKDAERILKTIALILGAYYSAKYITLVFSVKAGTLAMNLGDLARTKVPYDLRWRLGRLERYLGEEDPIKVLKRINEIQEKYENLEEPAPAEEERRGLPQTCDTEYPTYPKCDWLEEKWGYEFWSEEEALDALKKQTGYKDLFVPRSGRKPSKDGPCIALGWHNRVTRQSTGTYEFSLVGCPCCLDTSAGPIADEMERWGIK